MEHKQRREQREAEEKRLKEQEEGIISAKDAAVVDAPAQPTFKIEKLNEVIGPRPTPGTKVKVHYTGKLEDGTVFDSSVTRGEPFTFNVGCGEVISGWDEGIVQLAKGQKAILTCPPEYAYGQRGSGMIPANATLTFEVELIDFDRFDF